MYYSVFGGYNQTWPASLILVLFARADCSLVVVCTFHRPIDAQFAGLHDFTTDYHLVEDLIHLVEVED